MKKGSFLPWHCILYLLFITNMLQAQTFVTNGSASFQGGNCYHLTPDVGGQAGSMFSMASINLTQPFAFDAVLNFGIKDANGADGIVFIFATTNTALGIGGGSIGYEGISPSIAIEYDDYFNSNFGDPTSDHMAVISDGSVNHGLPSNLVGPINLANIEDGEDHCFTVLWEPATQTLTAGLNSDLISYTGDIINDIFNGNPVVYYGFSSGTGSLSNLHKVCVGAPVVVPMMDVTICEGESVTLQADENGIAWTWENDPTLSETDISNPEADPVQTTTYMVTIEYPCGGTQMDTVIVNVNPQPTAIATNDGPVCPGETIHLMSSGGTSYHWNGPMGFNSFLQNPTILNMTPGKAGTYTVTITDSGGCTSTAETDVEIFDPPFVEIDDVNGPVCEDAEEIQLLGIPGGGDWGGEVDPNGVFDPGQAGDGTHNITYTITDANGCTNSDEIDIEVVPNVGADITPPGPFCFDDQVVTLNANPPGGTWGGIADSDGQIYPASLFPGLYSVTYDLTGPDECYNTEITIEIVESEMVTAPDLQPVCTNDPLFLLTGFEPEGGMYSGAADPDGEVDPGALGPGDHQIFYTYASGTCPPTTVDATLTVFGAPSFLNLERICNGTETAYTVSFQIVGGDPSSYSFDGTTGGNITPGNPSTFLSDPIPSGNAYSFQVFDANHCDTITIAGAYSCNCATQAGTMDQNPILVCENDTVYVIPATGYTLDPNDTIVYVLHTGDPLNFIAAGNGIAFPFQPPLVTGITYFISALVGNTIPGIGIDVSDPCLGTAHGPAVMWVSNPTAFFSAPSGVCTGDSAVLNFNLSGAGLFNISYSDGTDTFQLTNVTSPHAVTVFPSGNTTYTFVNIQSLAAPGCASVIDSSILIVVSDIIPSQQSLSICSGDSVFLAGDYQSLPGVFIDTILGTIGCDTVLQSTLVVHNRDTSYLSSLTCNANQAGVFENILTNQFGCDSTVISTVTLIPADTTDIFATTCDPNSAGIFPNLLTNQSGCDSLVYVHIDLLPSDTTELSRGDCDETEVGIFTQILSNQYGCDSVVIEEVLLLPGDSTQLSHSSCLPSDTGIFVTVLQNIYGCDSVVIDRVNLIASWLTNLASSTCDSNAAGTFTSNLISSQGCDSTVVEVVSLLPSNTIVLNNYTCEPLDTSTLEQHYINQFGCDSTVVLVTDLLPADSCIVITHEVYIPNVFSPNGDGINDAFFITGNPNSLREILYLRIFDRWGSLVMEKFNFQANDASLGWDGTFEDKPLNPGVFVWQAHLVFSDDFTLTLFGDLTLVR